MEHKSVSRKHLMLKVGDVAPEDCGDAYARHAITATDSSKTGTVIDSGSKLKGDSKVLNGNRHTIQLGSWDRSFTLEWHPVVLSYKLTKAAAMTAEREKLQGTGIKVIADYVGLTTHVVAKVRNTAHGLLGLVQARWLVTAEFVDALAVACMQDGVDGDGEPRVSPLEQDFDGNWPKEEDHFIPTAGEPVKRPAEWLKPNPDRCTVFNHFTFLLFSAKQRDSLSPVIQAGGGKALAYTFEKGVTTKDQVVEYIQSITGRKSESNFSLGHDEGPGGVVVIRAEAKDASRDNEFMASIDTALNQRSVEQNELLDVILENNASVLCRPLRLGTQTVPPTPNEEHHHPESQTASNNGAQAGINVEDTTQEVFRAQNNTEIARMQEESATTESQQRAATPPPDGMTALQRYKARKAIRQKDIKNEFDSSLVVRAASDSPEPSVQASSEAPSMQNRDYDESLCRKSDTQQSTRKRPAPLAEEPEETNEQMMDRLMPGVANYKRRKTQALRDGEVSLEGSISKSSGTGKKGDALEKPDAAAKGKQGVRSENKLQAQMRAQREKEDEERRKDEESMREMRNVDVDTIKIEHSVEMFDLPVRPPRQVTTASGEGRGDRWNPAWNDRPNFKKFRSKRDRQGRAGRTSANVELQRVVIPLEEIPGRGHGLGDEYWLEPSREKSKKKSQTQSQSQRGHTTAAAAADSDDDQLSFRRHLEQSRADDAEAAFADQFFEEAATSQSTLGRSQPKKTAGSSSTAVKRTATRQALGGPPAKKARQDAARQTTIRLPTSRQVLTIDDSDEEDDPLAFKRR